MSRILYCHPVRMCRQLIGHSQQISIQSALTFIHSIDIYTVFFDSHGTTGQSVPLFSSMRYDSIFQGTVGTLSTRLLLENKVLIQVWFSSKASKASSCLSLWPVAANFQFISSAHCTCWHETKQGCSFLMDYSLFLIQYIFCINN